MGVLNDFVVVPCCDACVKKSFLSLFASFLLSFHTTTLAAAVIAS